MCFLSIAQSNMDLREKASRLLSDPQALMDLYADHSRKRNSIINTELESLLEAIHVDSLLAPAEGASKHIFYTLSDDQGFADIGYNDQTFVTPTLDLFASKGVKFDNFYVHVRLFIK